MTLYLPSKINIFLLQDSIIEKARILFFQGTRCPIYIVCNKVIHIFFHLFKNIVHVILSFPFILPYLHSFLFINISNKMLDKDREIAKNEHLQIEIVKGNICDLSMFHNDFFDFIINPPSLMYIPKLSIVFIIYSSISSFFSVHYLLSRFTSLIILYIILCIKHSLQK